MATGKEFRRWILGLSCSVVPLMGCSQGPAPKTGRLFTWFRSAPLSDAEKKKQERHEANQKLKDPTNLHVKYAQWREQVGDLTDARKSYQFALKENPKSLEAQLGLARLDQLSGRPAEAERGFQNVLNARPGDPRALNAFGQFYASQRKWNKSLPLLEDAADAAPSELTYRHHFALALAQSGDIEASFAQFRQAVSDAEAHYNIGFLLYEQGHTILARKRFQQAVALNPNLHQAQALLDEIEGKTGRAVVAAASKPVSYPPVHRVEQASSEVHFPTAMESPRTVPEESPEPPAWVPAKQGTPISLPGPTASLPVEPAPAAPVAPATTPAVPEPRQSELPPLRPTWRKHQETAETTQQTSEYLPPYRPETNAETPTSEAAPAISPAQREQWENQRKAAAGR